MDPGQPSESTSSSTPALSYRLVTFDDEDELRRMRRVCGWGEDTVDGRIRRTLAGGEYLFLFFLDDPNKPIGMGGIELYNARLLDLADPVTDSVLISSLFIYPEYQARHFGNEIMTALETFATIHLRAKTLTVNTKALDPTDGVSDAKNVKWYKRRGYVEFQPRAIMYGDVWTAFLKKDAGPSVGGDKKDGAREAGTRSQAPTSSIEAEA